MGSTRYTYHGMKLLAEHRPTVKDAVFAGDEFAGTETVTGSRVTLVEYMHGHNGIVGIVVNGTTYTFRKNIMGDVTHILDTKGCVVAQYEYDAWGNHSVENFTDNEIGDLNPIRYRGYYYDFETKLYYLNTRYYDPAVGRFISPDKIENIDVLKNVVNGLNLYAYCLNNPVNTDDDNGEMPRWLRWVAVGVMAIAAITVTVLTFGAATPLAKLAFAAGVGAISFMGGSALSQGVQNGWNNIDPTRILQAGAMGAAIGAGTALGSMLIKPLATQLGGNLGAALANSTHLSRGRKFAHVLGVSSVSIINVSASLGGLIGGLIGGTMVGHTMNIIFGDPDNSVERTSNTLVNRIIDIFKRLRKII